MVLQIEGVSKRYGRGEGRLALQDFSLQLDRGQLMGIYGPSGAGKSTLLRIAAGLISPDEGRVLYNGEALDEMPASERKRLRRREVSCVWSAQPLQERLGVLDHVALALLVDGRDHRRAARAAGEALAACEVDHCAGMELRDISDGERQRVQIARAIVTEPRLLLADGPASSLSLPEQEAVMALLASLARDAKVAVLIADSDADALIGAEPILCLSGGRLIDAEPGQRGRVYRFPARARQAVADG